MSEDNDIAKSINLIITELDYILTNAPVNIYGDESEIFMKLDMLIEQVDELKKLLEIE